MLSQFPFGYRKVLSATSEYLAMGSLCHWWRILSKAASVISTLGTLVSEDERFALLVLPRIASSIIFSSLHIIASFHHENYLTLGDPWMLLSILELSSTGNLSSSTQPLAFVDGYLNSGTSPKHLNTSEVR